MAENKMKSIVVQSMGTRGDAQPMAAVSLRLQEEGYDVTVVTNEDSVPFVESAGVKARHVFFDMAVELAQNEKMKEGLETGEFTVQIEGMNIANKNHAPRMTKLWYEAVTEIKPDACISGTLCDLLGMVMLRHFNIPTITVGLQPIPANPPKMILGLPNVPCCGINGYIIRYMAGQMAQNEINTIGAELKKQYDIDWSKLMTKQEIVDSRISPPRERPVLLGADPLIAHLLYGGKEHVPKAVKLLGFFAMDEEKQVATAKQGELQKQKSNQFGGQAILDAIEVFCSEGKPPMYVGFGSMVAKSPEHMVVLLCQGVKLAGARAIMCKGWAGLSQALLEKSTKDAALIEYAKTNIKFVGNTPHPWLFPKCSFIVHHGGAGTTSTASRASVPQIIIPVFLDQWDMAHFLNVYGSGFGFVKQFTKVSAQEVGDAMKKVQADEKMKAKAKQWGEIALADRGARGFVDEFKAWLDEEVTTGKVAKHSEAVLKAIKK